MGESASKTAWFAATSSEVGPLHGSSVPPPSSHPAARAASRAPPNPRMKSRLVISHAPPEKVGRRELLDQVAHHEAVLDEVVGQRGEVARLGGRVDVAPDHALVDAPNNALIE